MITYFSPNQQPPGSLSAEVVLYFRRQFSSFLDWEIRRLRFLNRDWMVYPSRLGIMLPKKTYVNHNYDIL